MARSLDLNELSEQDLFDLMEIILDRLPAQDLLRVRELAEVKRLEKLEEAKNTVLAEFQGKLENLGLTLDDVLPRPSRRRGRGQSRRDIKQSVAVKYRSPEGETWSGRGRLPQWLQALEAQGGSRDEFLVQSDGE